MPAENPQIFLSLKDEVQLRYLMEEEYLPPDTCDAKQAKKFVVCRVAKHLWGFVDNMMLFGKHSPIVVVRNRDGNETEFDLSTLCDSEYYCEEGLEPNTELEFDRESFILFEASLRMVSVLICNGRYPEQDEMFRIALRLRAKVVSAFHQYGGENGVGIKTSDGRFVPLIGM